jgi:hypothetical protein
VCISGYDLVADSQAKALRFGMGGVLYATALEKSLLQNRGLRIRAIWRAWASARVTHVKPVVAPALRRRKALTLWIGGAVGHNPGGMVLDLDDLVSEHAPMPGLAVNSRLSGALHLGVGEARDGGLLGCWLTPTKTDTHLHAL